MPHVPPRPLRADARRNRDRILAAAEKTLARDGVEASLEEIARRAGVGSATLHRHFPSRRALLDAVFHDRVRGLAVRAQELADAPDPGAALVTWLRALAAYATTIRGLTEVVLADTAQDAPADQDDTCNKMLQEAGNDLVQRAQAAGAIRVELAVEDLLALVNAISLVAGPATDQSHCDRLLDIALDGIYPCMTSRTQGRAAT